MNMTIATMRMIHRKIKITRDFRLFCAGRLYWRDKNTHWSIWDSADIACVVNRDKTRQMFTRLDEIESYVIDCLAYPDDKLTADFQKPRKKPAKLRLTGLIDLSAVVSAKQPDCPDCGRKHSMVEHVVQSPLPGEDHIFYRYHQCDYCRSSDHEELVRTLESHWKQQDFPF